MSDDKLNSYITNRLIANMIVRYNSELTNGRDISEIKKELLLHDDYVQKKVIEGLDSGLIKKSQALNNANEKGKKVLEKLKLEWKKIVESTNYLLEKEE